MIQFELTIDDNGSPIIKFRDNQVSHTLEDKILRQFTRLAKSKGLILTNRSGGAGSDQHGNRVAYENYTIEIKSNE